MSLPAWTSIGASPHDCHAQLLLRRGQGRLRRYGRLAHESVDMCSDFHLGEAALMVQRMLQGRPWYSFLGPGDAP